MPINSDASRPQIGGKQGTGKFVILHIFRKSTGQTTEKMIFTTPQDITLSFGDKIMCVEGMAAVLINPGSPAGAYIVCPQVPVFTADAGKYRVVLEINEETTRKRRRGSISVEEDIGSVLANKGTATTR